MKRFIALFIGLLLVGMVLAQSVGTAESELEALSGSVKPDSALYGLDIALTNLKVFVTRDRVAKADLLLDVANERLAEKTLMRLRGKSKEADEAERDEVKKGLEASETLNSISQEDVKRNPVLYESVRRKGEQRTIVLNRVIEKLRTDSNPGNDHAIDSLTSALNKENTDKERLEEARSKPVGSVT